MGSRCWVDGTQGSGAFQPSALCPMGGWEEHRALDGSQTWKWESSDSLGRVGRQSVGREDSSIIHSLIVKTCPQIFVVSGSLLALEGVGVASRLGEELEGVWLA